MAGPLYVAAPDRLGSMVCEHLTMSPKGSVLSFDISLSTLTPLNLETGNFFHTANTTTGPRKVSSTLEMA